jgi:clan AA aspartic protease
VSAHKTVSLNDAGHPIIKVKVWGVAEQFAQEFEALVDTGFTGFLSLPLTAALPLGLTLISTVNYTMADGSSTSSLVALGTVDYEGQKIFGAISLELSANSTSVLVGMEFIKEGKLMLLLHSNSAMLIDLDTLQKESQEEDKQSQQPSEAQSGQSSPSVLPPPQEPPVSN